MQESMSSIFNNIKSFINYFHFNNWYDYLFFGIMVMVLLVVVIAVLLMTVYILSLIYQSIFYKTYYSRPKTVSGLIVGMNYEPAYTSSIYNNNTVIVSTTPEMNEVFIKTDLDTFELDSDELYQQVRVDEPVELTYQQVFLKPRFWEGDFKFYLNHLIKVKNIKNKVVILDDEKKYPLI